MDAQEIANQLGQTQRDLEQAIAAKDYSRAKALAMQQHDNLGTLFAIARDQHGIQLDWSQASGDATQGGGSKDAPATVEA